MRVASGVALAVLFAAACGKASQDDSELRISGGRAGEGTGGASASAAGSDTGGVREPGAVGGASGGGPSNPAGGGSPSSGGQSTCFGCPRENGCLTTLISRHADDSQQPWTRGVPGADGIGTLVVTAVQGRFRFQRRIPSVDMKPSSSAVEIDFGCMMVGYYDVVAFLDDDENASGDLVRSSEPADSCPGVYGPEQVQEQVGFGLRATVELKLGGSCDLESD